MFQAPRLTGAGKALYYKALEGRGITFTKIKLGKGALSGPITELTDLIDTVAEVDAAVAAARDNSYVEVSGAFSNTSLNEGFYWREIGLFAADPEAPDARERDILYCYQNAYDTADYIPSASVETVEKHITIPVIVADAANISCLLDPSLIYTTQNDVKKYVSDAAGYISGIISGLIIKKTITIPAGGWQAAAGDAPNGMFADITVDEATSDMMPLINLSPDDCMEAKACGMSTMAQTFEKRLRIYSEKAPGKVMRAELTLISPLKGDIDIDNMVPSYTLPIATATRLGGVKIGENVNVTEDGTISVKGLPNDAFASESDIEDMLNSIFEPSGEDG